MKVRIDRRLLGLGLVGAALVAAPAALGDSPGKEKVRFNAADQAAARGTVLRLTDFGSANWRGGAKKPDISAGPFCANYHPKQSDLVLTGAAETEFYGPGVDIDSEAQVLQTARMVALDWQRSVLAPTAVPCIRQTLATALGAHGKLVSFQSIAFPKIARYVTAFQIVFDANVQGISGHWTMEVVLIGAGRTEITLTATSAPPPLASPAALAEQTVHLAGLLAGRARA